jgi:hypothetical protein
MGQIMFIGASATFIVAGLMLILSGLGIAHLRRTPLPESEVLPKLATRVEVTSA